MTLNELIVSLCGLPTVSGSERRSTEALRGLIGAAFDEMQVDALGNHLFIKRCGRQDAPKILIDTHLDEIGMMVNGYRDGGFLTVANVGGVDTRILPAGEVVIYGKETLYGVVAAEPAHLLPGAVLIAFHARTREQMYTPGIDPSIIAAVKDAVHVPVLGNGDIRTAEDAVRMVEETGCDGVMIARAALGDPWLFERVNAALEGLPAPKEPNLQARMNALRRQVEEMVEQKGEFVAMPQARAQTMHYMKGLKGAASLRRYCCELSRLSDLDTLIDAVFEQQRRAAQDPDDTREVPFP